MNTAQALLYHGTLIPLQQAIAGQEWEIEDLKAEIREAAEDGGDLYYLNQALSYAEESLAEMLVDFEEINEHFDGLDG